MANSPPKPPRIRCSRRKKALERGPVAVAVEKVKAIYTFIARNLGINTHNALGRKIKTLKKRGPCFVSLLFFPFFFCFLDSGRQLWLLFTACYCYLTGQSPLFLTLNVGTEKAVEIMQ